MKYFKIITILLLSSAISFYACNDNSDTIRQKARESLTVSSPPTLPNAAVQNPAIPQSNQNTEGVWHYTCSQGCAGGGGKDDNCITCGGSLAHNQAYHASDNIAAPANSITPSATPPVVEPAQNVTGVWHYTCGNGCAGGAGVTGICGTCGDALAHNPVYHQEGTLIQ
jgi:hypothetical protein